jgi:hypothetical protein
MSKEHAGEESQHAGVRRALRREQQRQKARQGMRIGTRPDSLRPVTVSRVQKLTQGVGPSRTKNRPTRG